MRTQRGMTLIEVLVTLVVTSVGLLGVAALQLTSLKGNQEAYVRSQASTLASDILDRMRANRNGVRVGDYSNVALNDVVGTGGGARAASDLSDWQAQIDELLPGDALAGGAIDVVTDAATDTHVVTITIQWSERLDRATFREDAGDATPFFRTRTEI